MLPKPVAVGEKKASGQQKGRDDVKHENSGRHFDVKKFELKNTGSKIVRFRRNKMRVKSCSKRSPTTRNFFKNKNVQKFFQGSFPLAMNESLEGNAFGSVRFRAAAKESLVFVFLLLLFHDLLPRLHSRFLLHLIEFLLKKLRRITAKIW